MAMDDQQVQHLLNGLVAGMRAHGRKVPTFSTANGRDWITWRRNFNIATNINTWDNRRARREIGASMISDALDYVGDIDIGDVDNAAPYIELLDAYEHRFLPAAAGAEARVSVRDAKQEEQETLPAWNARMRRLYQRAHPGMNAAALEANQDLRDTFILGIADAGIRKLTWDGMPADYAASLVLSTGFDASSRIVGGAPAKIKIEPGIHTLEDVNAIKNGTPTRCFYCDRPGHYKRDCRMWLSTQREGGATSFRGGFGYGPQRRGGRGGRGNQGRGAGNRGSNSGNGGRGRGRTDEARRGGGGRGRRGGNSSRPSGDDLRRRILAITADSQADASADTDADMGNDGEWTADDDNDADPGNY